MHPVFASLSIATVLLTVVSATLGAQARAAGTLFDAIRRNDATAAKSLIASGTGVNAPDENGATR
jgi:hypothetical protein